MQSAKASAKHQWMYHRAFCTNGRTGPVCLRTRCGSGMAPELYSQMKDSEGSRRGDDKAPKAFRRVDAPDCFVRYTHATRHDQDRTVSLLPFEAFHSSGLVGTYQLSLIRVSVVPMAVATLEAPNGRNELSPPGSENGIRCVA